MLGYRGQIQLPKGPDALDKQSLQRLENEVVLLGTNEELEKKGKERMRMMNGKTRGSS